MEFTNRNCTLFSRYSRMKVHMRNADSNLAALIRALKCLQPIQTLNYAFLVQTNESEIARVQPLLRFSWFKPETALNGDWMAIQNRCLHFAQRNVFGLCRCLCVLNWSGNTNRGSKGVSGCWENWDLLCLCSPPPILSHLTVILNFLGNRWSHSSPVSIFQTDSTPLIACKGRKPSAAWIRDLDFRGRSILVMLSIFTAIFDYLSNSKSFSSSV